MSSLWMERYLLALVRNLIQMPFPMCDSLIREYVTEPCIEKTYLPASRRMDVRKKRRDSMTVEAAIVAPLLILFVLHLGSCMEMLRLHGKLEYALWQTGREMTFLGAVQGAEDIPDLAVSYLYVNGRIQQILGNEYLNESPLIHGSQELTYLSSEYLKEDECVDIVLTYQVGPQITCFPFPYFRMCNRYYGRVWTGYAVGDETEKKLYVYVTEDGEAWHGRGDCTYLKPTVFEAEPESLWMLRNADGEIYRPCSRCGDRPAGELLYLTREGNRSHTARDCPALLRRVRMIQWQEDMSYRPCSRCGVLRQSEDLQGER